METPMKLILQITAGVLLAALIEWATGLTMLAAASHGIVLGIDHALPKVRTPTRSAAPPYPGDSPTPTRSEPPPTDDPHTMRSARDCNTPENPHCSIHASSSSN
jgi:hypothetical protein